MRSHEWNELEQVPKPLGHQRTSRERYALERLPLPLRILKAEDRFKDPFSEKWYYYLPDCPYPASTRPLTAVSLFTGAGGLDLGLEMAGFSVSCCIEIDCESKKTLSQNRASWPILQECNGDVRKISAETILSFTHRKPGEFSLVSGGAPCQPFSNIGSRSGTESEDGQLYLDFIRIVEGLEPCMFVFENVEGIKKFSRVFHDFMNRLSPRGYKMSQAVLNSADYGVPQLRKRVIILGRRDGVEPGLPFPTHNKSPEVLLELYRKAGYEISHGIQAWKTVAQALSELDEGDLLRPDCMVMSISEKVRQRMKYVHGVANFKAIPSEYLPNCWKSGKHQGADTFGRLYLDRPSVTIRTCAYNPSKGRYIHPIEDRGLNTIEMAILQSFPREWRFQGSLVSVGRQIGNAVPPLLGYAIGRACRTQIKEICETTS